MFVTLIFLLHNIEILRVTYSTTVLALQEVSCWINEKSDWREIMKIGVIEYRYALTRVIACGDNSTGTDKPGSIIRDRLLTDDVQ